MPAMDMTAVGNVQIGDAKKQIRPHADRATLIPQRPAD